MGGIEPLHIQLFLDLKDSPNPSWNRGGPLASKEHARKPVSPPTESFISESGPPKNTLFWRNRTFFPVVSRSNPRCSKAQIASYLARIRRFLAPIAWASSASTTKKISPQSTQAWFRKGSRRFWASFFLGNGWKSCPWHACGTIGWNNTMTYPWEESSLYISSCFSHWQVKSMPGRPCHIPQIPLFLKVARQKTTYFGEIGRFFPWPLEAIHAAAKLKLRAIWPK